jgi:transmembrane sensor
MLTDTNSPDLPELNRQAINWLVTLRGDKVSEDTLHSFAGWLSENAAHAAAFAQAEDMFEGMANAGASLRAKIGTLAETELANNLAIKPAPAVNKIPAKSSNHAFSKSWLSAPLALAAVWLMTVLGVMPLRSYTWDAVFSDYHTGTGEQRDIALADGSRMLLNTQTAVSVEYRNNLRLITLHHGQVRFTVAKDTRQPFEVETDALAIRALGTVFDVYRQDSGDLTVSVQEHAVLARLLKPQDDPAKPVQTLVNQGQHLQYHRGEALPTAQNGDISTLTAWQQHKLFINDRPLGEFVEELNRYRQGKIFIPDRQLNALRVTGVFTLSNADDTLANLSTALALRQTRLGPWWVVLHR